MPPPNQQERGRVVSRGDLLTTEQRLIPASEIPVFDTQRGQWRSYRDTEDLETAYLTGKIAFGADQPVPVVDPDGNTYTVQGRELGQALRYGMRIDAGPVKLARLRLEEHRRQVANDSALATAGREFLRLIDPVGFMPRAARELGAMGESQAMAELRPGGEGFLVGGESAWDVGAEGSPYASTVGSLAALVTPIGAEAAAGNLAGRAVTAGAARVLPAAGRAMTSAAARSLRQVAERQVARRAAMQLTEHVGHALVRQGSGVAARILGGAAEGAVGGVLDTARQSFIDDDPITAESLLNGGLLGAAIGIGVTGAFEAASAGARQVGRLLSSRAAQVSARDHIEALRKVRLATDGIDISPPVFDEKATSWEHVARVMTGGSEEQVKAIRQFFAKDAPAYASEAKRIISENLPELQNRLMFLEEEMGNVMADYRIRLGEFYPHFRGDPPAALIKRVSKNIAEAEEMGLHFSKPHLEPGFAAGRAAFEEANRIIASLKKEFMPRVNEVRLEDGSVQLRPAHNLEIYNAGRFVDHLVTARSAILAQAAKTPHAPTERVLREMADTLVTPIIESAPKRAREEAARLLDEMAEFELARFRMRSFVDENPDLPGVSPEDDPFHLYSTTKLGRIFARAYSNPRLTDLERLNSYVKQAYRMAKRSGNQVAADLAKRIEADAVDVFAASYAEEGLRKALSREGMSAAAIGNAAATAGGLILASAGVNPIIAFAAAVGLRMLQRPLTTAQQIGTITDLVKKYTGRLDGALTRVLKRIETGLPQRHQGDVTRVGILAFMGSSSREERIEAYQNLEETIRRMASDPSDLQTRVAALSDSNSPLVDQLGYSAAMAVQVISNALPRQVSNVLMPDRVMPLSDTEIQEALTVARAALDPVTIFEDFAAGAPLSPSAVEAARLVAPETYQRGVDRIMEAIGNLTKDIPYPTKLQLGVLLQAPIDPTFDSSMILALQDRSSQTQAQARTLGVQRRTARSVKTTLARQYVTISQSLREVR